MSGNGTAGSPLVTAADWLAGGQRIAYEPESARVLTEEEAAAASGSCRSHPRHRERHGVGAPAAARR